MNYILTNPKYFILKNPLAHVKCVLISDLHASDISVYSTLLDSSLLWFTVEITVAVKMLSKLHYKQLVGSLGQRSSHDACCCLFIQ